MKIKDESFPVPSFEEFADRHGLTVVINERPITYGLPRFYAQFEDSATSEPGVLVGTYGNGNTKEEAIRDYASELIGKRLVVGAYTPERREIQCPNEWKVSR